MNKVISSDNSSEIKNQIDEGVYDEYSIETDKNNVNAGNFPPEKVKINGVKYVKDESFDRDKLLNATDKSMLAKASKIKYNPPLSYRWLKIFGLFSLILPFLLLRLAVSFPNLEYDFVAIIIDIANVLSLPLVIFSAYVVILKSQQKGKLIITYALIAIGIYFMLFILFERYFMGILAKLNPDKPIGEVREMANGIALSMKIFHYNIFIDLFLCTLFFYFTNATPKKIAGNHKKMVAFRMCSLIPVIYVVVAMILSGLLQNGAIKMDVALVGLLTCRSPATYLMFFSISLFLSILQRNYVKYGGTIQGFQEYKKTKAHSITFSIACSIIILITCLLDFLFGLIPGSSSFGIGSSSLMFSIIPFIMLVSYTKEHKNKTIDLFLPVVSIIIIVFLVLDTLFTVYI